MARSKKPRLRTVIIPVEHDATVFVQGYTDTAEMRVRFEEGGFLHEGLFRHVLNKGRNNEVFDRGPVSITAHVDEDEVSMDIVITLHDGKTVRKSLTVDACDEIEERLDAVRLLLHGYRRDPGFEHEEKPASSAAA